MNTVVLVIIVLAVALASMILHELAHGLVAHWLGDDTAKEAGRLTLNPLKHLDPFMSVLVPVLLFLMGGPVFGGAKPVPVNKYKLKFGEWGMALVALAGPLTNFLLALLVFLISYFTGVLFDVNTGYLAYACWMAISMNLGFMLFNLIPIPPLDGSRVLYAIAPDKVRGVMEQLEGRWGIAMIYILIIIFAGVLGELMSNGMAAIFNFFLMLVGAPGL